MNKLFLILFFILICFNISAQYVVDGFKYKKPFKESRIPESVKVISIYAGSIILNAVGDGLKDSEHKEWGHACNAASIGLLLTSPFIIDYDKSKWGWYLASYVSLRIIFFDPAYNLSRGLPITYIGGTSTWDKVLGKMSPPDGFMVGRGVSLIFGISIPINEFNSSRKLIKGIKR
jgi:hypothetical protein